jgi:hypothetical protein
MDCTVPFIDSRVSLTLKFCKLSLRLVMLAFWDFPECKINPDWTSYIQSRAEPGLQLSHELPLILNIVWNCLIRYLYGVRWIFRKGSSLLEVLVLYSCLKFSMQISVTSTFVREERHLRVAFTNALLASILICRKPPAGYQAVLSRAGLNEVIMASRRGASLLSQNKEGVASACGQCAFLVEKSSVLDSCL